MLSCIHFAIGCLNIFMKNQWMENRDPTEYYMAFRVKAIKFQNKTKIKQSLHMTDKATDSTLNERKKKKKLNDIDIILGSFEAGCWSLLRILLVRMRVWKAVD